MDAMLDTLAASRKLEESGMPEPQAEAVVEVVNDAMKDLVTKKYLKIEFERNFKKFERKIDRKLDERFGKIDERFGEIDERFRGIDERLGKMDEKFDKINTNFNELRLSIAELGKSQAWGFVYVCGITMAAAALLFTALQFFGIGAAAAPMNFPEPGGLGGETPEVLATPPENDIPPPGVTLEPDPATDL